MLKGIEHARVRTTGDRVIVLRRHGIARDQQIMLALEAAGAFVIGTPGGFRYRRANKRRFIRPAGNDVFVLDSTASKVTKVLPADYFAEHYEVIPALTLHQGGLTSIERTNAGTEPSRTVLDDPVLSHGSRSLYRKGCRCAACTEAQASYYRDWEQRRRLERGGR